MSFSNIKSLSAFNLKNSKRGIFLWSIVLFGIVFMYMILFPSMKDLAQVKLDSLPKEILQLFGMESFLEMSNYNSYFAMIYGFLVLVISLYITSFATGSIVNEEKNGSIEFLYSQSLTRGEIYCSKAITSCVALFSVILACALAAILCGVLVGGETFELFGILQILKITGFTPFVFMALGLMVGGVSSRFGTSQSSIMFVVLSYMLGYLGLLLEDKGKVLRYFSPFELLSPRIALDISSELMLQVFIIFLVSIVFITLGITVYKRRDLKL